MIERHFHDLIVDGKSLADFGVHISGTGVFDSPEKDYEVVEVPGRSGDLLFSKNRYKNYELTYPAFILYHFREQVAELRAFLLSRKGYVRIEDTYYPDEFRLGYFQGPLEFDPIMLTGSEFEIKFMVKPQRYLKIGEKEIFFDNTSTDLTQNFRVTNPTYFTSKPLIKIHRVMSGSTDQIVHVLYVNSVSLTIKGGDSNYVIIDSETQDIYDENHGNWNGKVVLDNKVFPEFEPGNNMVRIHDELPSTGNTYQILITPRWYTL